jgi:acyl-CoA reductase-like NAD-dependent aldehyde dehydrogenase
MAASSQPHHQPTSHSDVDLAVARLRERSQAWAALALEDRLAYLRSAYRGTWAIARDLVADACRAKGLRGAQAGEEWVAGIIPQLRTMRILLDTLEGIRRTGRVPLPENAVRVRPDGQVTIRVVPTDIYDRVLYRGFTADIWVDPAVTRADLEQHLGSFYTKGVTPPAQVALVLGAGNVASIGPLDVIHKLFFEGATVLVKFSRVNEYLGPHFERAWADLIADGFVRIVYGGGADVGVYAAHLPDVAQVHLTGSGRTYDSVVWGSGEEASTRKASGTPLLDKPVSCELGNVSPVVIVPGEWSDRALRLRAEDVATQIVQNDGFNCNAARVLVMAEGWPQREAFLGQVHRVLASLPVRPAYYPDAETTYDRFLAAHDRVETFGRRTPGFLPPALLVDLNPEEDHLAFREEAWCPMAATTSLPGATPAEFLGRAVSFCNQRLSGTLNATVIADGGSVRTLGPAWDAALAGLRYGTVAVNVWGAAGFVLGPTPWGGFPGHTPTAIGSGLGFVHNARLVDRPQKGVVHAPFGLFPKPPWFVTHRNAHRVLSRVAALDADPHLWRLPGIGLWDLLS